MNPYLAALIAAVASIVVGWLGFVASRAKQRADTGQQMIDQHQEDIKDLRQETAALRRELAGQRQEQEAQHRIQRIQGDYIGQLRQHIVDGRPPPPPPYPAGLIS